MATIANNPYRAAGLRFHTWGANVNAICQRNDLKAAAHPWKQYQTERQTRNEVERLPWAGYTAKTGEQVTITGVAVINGIGTWRTLDLDACPGFEPVATILAHLHLPPDYAWVARTGSGNGWHIDVRCAGPIPPGVLTAKDKEKGVYTAASLRGDFDHLELRWEHCQTIKPPSHHKSGGTYQWHNTEPTEPPALVSIEDLLAAWHAVAQKAPPAPPKADAQPRRERDAAEAAEDEQVKEQIRRNFDLVAYARKNFAGEIEEIGDEVRVHDQGGLLIQPARDIWYCHLAHIGGDCFDLAGYHLHGEKWNREDPKMFVEALKDAAYFTGVSLPERRNGRERDDPTPELPGYLAEGAEEVITSTPARRTPAAPAHRPVAEIITELEALRPEAGGKAERTKLESAAADLVSDCAGLKNGDLLKVEATLRDLGAAERWLIRWRSDVKKTWAEQQQSDEAGRETQAQALMRIASTAEFFRTPGGDLYARFESQGHRETHPLRERGSTFRYWLTRQYMAEADGPASPTAMSSVMDALEARAYYGPEIEVFTRVARHEGAIYLDMADTHWRAIKITPAGWEVVAKPPVAFRRAKGMLPLPMPKRSAGKLSALLRPFVNLPEDDKSLKLIIGWLVGALSPDGPYAQLALYGEQGTAKSTVTRLLRAIIDPNEAMARSAPKEDRDLAIAAKNSWIVAFDNLSSLPDWLSDALCRLSTGAASSTRALYTDDDEALFSAKRPVIVNGIEEIVSRGDLLDRLISITLPVIPRSKRQTERKFWATFEAAHPALLGALLDVAAVALHNLGTIQVADLPRLADFALWVESAAPALDWQPGEFLKVFDVNQEQATQTEIDASPLAQLFLKVCEQKITPQHPIWTTAAEPLREELAKLLPEDEQKKKPKWFPGAAQWLSNKLRRLAPALRTKGWEVDCDAYDSAGRRKAIEIRKAKTIETSPESATQLQRNLEARDAIATQFQTNCVATPIMKEPQQPTLEADSATQYAQFAPIPILSSVAREVSGREEEEEARARSEKLQSEENCVNCDDSDADPAGELEVFEL